MAKARLARCVVFLRAINVGGRFLKMAELAAHFRQLGFADAQTYINSGNVLISAPPSQAAALAARIEDGLAPLLGFTSEAFVRSADELRDIAARAAAQRAALGEHGEVNVIFLQQPLMPEQQALVAAMRNEVDDFVFAGTELLWLCRTRQSESTFSGAVLERRLRQRCTVRRARMLQGLVPLLEAPPAVKSKVSTTPPPAGDAPLSPPKVAPRPRPRK